MHWSMMYSIKNTQKGRRLNPCQIATFQDVPVIGVFDMRNVDEPDIWGNANYLKYIRKKL